MEEYSTNVRLLSGSRSGLPWTQKTKAVFSQRNSATTALTPDISRDALIINNNNYCTEGCIYLIFFQINSKRRRAKSFEACCQKPLRNVLQNITLLFTFTVQKYINYPSVNKMHAGTFRGFVIHRTLTWTTGSLTCVPHHFYAFVRIRIRGSGTHTHRQRISATFLTRKKHTRMFLVLLTECELGVTDVIES